VLALPGTKRGSIDDERRTRGWKDGYIPRTCQSAR
jgi:hypothetical protein